MHWRHVTAGKLAAAGSPISNQSGLLCSNEMRNSRCLSGHVANYIGNQILARGDKLGEGHGLLGQTIKASVEFRSHVLRLAVSTSCIGLG
jgi:hypothetical protein